MAVTELCQKLETDLIKLIEVSKNEKLNLAWFESLDDFFTQIKLHFQMKIPEFEFQTNPKTGFLPTIFMVDVNKEFLSDFSSVIQPLDFELVTESNPDNALGTLLKLDFYPEILLFNARYPNSAFTGYELIKIFYRNNSELTNTIALIIEEKSIKNQIEALQKGMLAVITKPFSPPLILPILEEIPFRPLPFSFKILVIDDDVDVCQYIQKSLKYFRLEVRVLRNVTDIEKSISSEMPDLILLDINLTDESGREVLHKLRTDCGYQNLIVGMLTPKQQESNLLQQCYDENVNDLLFKPLERSVLQRKVAHLLKHKTEQKLSEKHTGKSNLANLQTFKKYLNEFLHYSQGDIVKMLVVFEIQGISKASSKIKGQITDYISLACENLLRKNEIAARLEGESFAFIFQGYAPSFVQLFIRSFLEDIQVYLRDQLLLHSFQIHEALLLFKNGDKLDLLLEKSEELLELARQETEESISMVTDPSFVTVKAVNRRVDSAKLCSDSFPSFTRFVRFRRSVSLIE